MAITCDNVQMLLVSFVAGETSEQEFMRINAHLQSCQRCQKTIAEIRQNLDVYAKARAIEPRPETWEAIEREVNTPSRVKVESEPELEPIVSLLQSPYKVKIASIFYFLTAVIIILLGISLAVWMSLPWEVDALMEFTGQANVKRQGTEQWQPLTAQILLSGDQLQTLAGKAVTITLLDGGTLQVLEQSQLLWQDERNIFLLHGTVQIRHPQEIVWTLQTAQVTSEVRNAVVDISATNDHSVVTVRNGTAVLVNDKGRVEMGKGQQSEIFDAAPTPAFDVDVTALPIGQLAQVPMLSMEIEIPSAHYTVDDYIPLTVTLSNLSERMAVLMRYTEASNAFIVRRIDADGSIHEQVLDLENVSELGSANRSQQTVHFRYHDDYMLGFNVQKLTTEAGHYKIQVLYQPPASADETMWTTALESSIIGIEID